MNLITFPVIVIVLVVWYILASIKILREYERAVIFRLGRVLPEPKGPGLILVFAPIDRMVRISTRTITMDIPPQDVITKDNVTVKVNAVLYFKVIEPIKCVIKVQDYGYATSQLAQTTLRSLLGQVPLDDLLSGREKLNMRLQEIIEQHTDPWWVISSIRSASVDLPWSMCATMQKFRMREMSVATGPHGTGGTATGGGREPLVRGLANMANIKSQTKRNIQNEKRHQRNIAQKSALKTSQKKVQAAVASGDVDTATAVQLQAARDLDKAASKGTMHKKTVARKKSRMAKAVNAASSAS